MATAKKLMTADELIVMPDDAYRYELLWGELHRMAPPDADHAGFLTDVAAALNAHVKPRGLG